MPRLVVASLLLELIRRLDSSGSIPQPRIRTIEGRRGWPRWYCRLRLALSSLALSQAPISGCSVGSQLVTAARYHTNIRSCASQLTTLSGRPRFYPPLVSHRDSHRVRLSPYPLLFLVVSFLDVYLCVVVGEPSHSELTQVAVPYSLTHERGPDSGPRSPAIQGECSGDLQTAHGQYRLATGPDDAESCPGLGLAPLTIESHDDGVVPVAAGRNHPSIDAFGDPPLFDCSWSEALLGAGSLFNSLDLCITTSDIANFTTLQPLNDEIFVPWLPLLPPLEYTESPGRSLSLPSCASTPTSFGCPTPTLPTNWSSPCLTVASLESPQPWVEPIPVPPITPASPLQYTTVTHALPELFATGPDSKLTRGSKIFLCDYSNCPSKFESSKRLMYAAPDPPWRVAHPSSADEA